MKIVKIEEGLFSSCNFCKSGKLNSYKNGLVYPYDHVYQLTNNEGSGLAAVICPSCCKDLETALYNLSWIDWPGGERPVSKHTLVQVIRGDGEKHMGEAGDKLIGMWDGKKSLCGSIKRYRLYDGR